MQPSAVLLSTCCVLLTVMPTIEKLLNADWKEKLLDKSTVGAGQLKGQLSDTTNTFIPFISHLYTIISYTLLLVCANVCLIFSFAMITFFILTDNCYCHTFQKQYLAACGNLVHHWLDNFAVKIVGFILCSLKKKKLRQS